MTSPYQRTQPSHRDVEQLQGPAILQFGTDWCGYCNASEPVVEAALAERPEVRRIKVEDGKGRALGRAFQVKLWPTLIFLRDGREVGRVVRPQTVQEIAGALALL